MDRLKEIPIRVGIDLKTKEESIELSELLESNGYEWYSDNKLTEVNLWNNYGEGTLYILEKDNKVSCMQIDYADVNQILTLEEFKQKYVIYGNKRVENQSTRRV